MPTSSPPTHNAAAYVMFCSKTSLFMAHQGCPTASAVTMRNENGVVITLSSELQGVQLALATQGLRISLSR